MKLDIRLPDTLKRVMTIFDNNRTPAVLVGGCVRDVIMNKEPHDYDVATYLTSFEVVELFSKQEGIKILEVGKAFGVVMLVVEGDKYEIATYRTETSYNDSRHPDKVEFVKDLKTDLLRRDFTCNSLAMDMYGNVYDYNDGLKDIKSGVIRAVGAPEERFAEDPLRILRALRFSVKMGFVIEANTDIALRANAYLLTKISKERVNSELVSILGYSGAANLLNKYRDVFAVVIPELRLMFDFAQNNRYHIYDVWHHSLEAMKVVETHWDNDPMLKMIALLHDIGKPAVCTEDKEGVRHFYTHPIVSADLAYGIMRRLKFSNTEVSRVVETIKYHDVTMVATRPAVKRLMNKIGVETFKDVCKFRLCDLLAHNPLYIEDRIKALGQINLIKDKLIEEGTALKVTDLVVDGYDMMNLGYTGKYIGIAQRDMLEKVIAEELENERGILIDYLKDKKTLDKIINSTKGY